MNLILADSNDLIRIGLRAILSNDKAITIVSEAHNGEELLAQVKSFDTSLVLIDYTSSGFNIDIIPLVKSLM